MEKGRYQRGIPGLRPHPEVNNWPPKIAEFLGFSGPIIGQRDVPSKASWRREWEPCANLLRLAYATVRQHLNEGR
jgi:hypothetical protein